MLIIQVLRDCPLQASRFGFAPRFRALRQILLSTLVLAAVSCTSAALAQSALLPTGEISSPPENSLSKLISPPAPEQVGDALVYHRRYIAAISAYKQAPESSVVWNKIGMAFQLIFDLQDAASAYQKALKLDPLNCRALNNLGTVYDALKEPGKAQRMYREAIRLNRNVAIFHRNLGSSLISQQRFAEGWASYEDALNLDPKVFERNNVKQPIPDGTPKDRGALNFFMARGCARAGKHACALEYLRKSFSEGFTDKKKIEADVDFAQIVELPEFKALFADDISRRKQSAQ